MKPLTTFVSYFYGHMTEKTRNCFFKGCLSRKIVIGHLITLCVWKDKWYIIIGIKALPVES